MLDITVFKVPELSKTIQVSETGTINLPLVGEVQAAGKTTQELERVLTAKLGATYLQNPQVSVLVKENNSQHVVVQGAVEKTGVYPIRGKTTLMELVAMAGGLKSNLRFHGVSGTTGGGKTVGSKIRHGHDSEGARR